MRAADGREPPDGVQEAPDITRQLRHGVGDEEHRLALLGAVLLVDHIGHGEAPELDMAEGFQLSHRGQDRRAVGAQLAVLPYHPCLDREPEETAHRLHGFVGARPQGGLAEGPVQVPKTVGEHHRVADEFVDEVRLRRVERRPRRPQVLHRGIRVCKAERCRGVPGLGGW